MPKKDHVFTVRVAISMNPPIGDPFPDKVYDNLSEPELVHLERRLVNVISKLTQIGEDITSGKAVEPAKLPERTYVKIDFSVVDNATGNEWAGMGLRYPNLDRLATEMINGLIEGEVSTAKDDVKKKRRHHGGGKH